MIHRKLSAAVHGSHHSVGWNTCTRHRLPRIQTNCRCNRERGGNAIGAQSVSNHLGGGYSGPGGRLREVHPAAVTHATRSKHTARVTQRGGSCADNLQLSVCTKRDLIGSQRIDIWRRGDVQGRHGDVERRDSSRQRSGLFRADNRDATCQAIGEIGTRRSQIKRTAIGRIGCRCRIHVLNDQPT